MTWENVAEMVKTFLAGNPEAEWGAAHTVLSDLNLEDYFINNALIELRNETPINNEVIVFLQQLLKIPEDVRSVDRME